MCAVRVIVMIYLYIVFPLLFSYTRRDNVTFSRTRTEFTLSITRDILSTVISYLNRYCRIISRIENR